MSKCRTCPVYCGGKNHDYAREWIRCNVNGPSSETCFENLKSIAQAFESLKQEHILLMEQLQQKNTILLDMISVVSKMIKDEMQEEGISEEETEKKVQEKLRRLLRIPSDAGASASSGRVYDFQQYQKDTEK